MYGMQWSMLSSLPPGCNCVEAAGWDSKTAVSCILQDNEIQQFFSLGKRREDQDFVFSFADAAIYPLSTLQHHRRSGPGIRHGTELCAGDAKMRGKGNPCAVHDSRASDITPVREKGGKGFLEQKGLVLSSRWLGLPVDADLPGLLGTVVVSQPTEPACR